MIRKPQILLLSLAVTAALAACGKKEEAAPAAGSAATTATAEPAALKLDESKLPKANSFLISDLDTSKNACTDFSGYANGKWLAANAIPGDRASWGSFEVLGERSTAVQQQLAEQAAADKNATGVEKIVGDLWATGMDEAKINAQG
ncbi:MAG: peptidase, partial [Pseudoxanthomonas sp.]